MRIAVVQLAYGEGSEESVGQRAARVADLVREQRGHDLVVLPELWSAGGFSSRDWEERAQVLETGALSAALVPVAEVAREIGAVVHAGSVVERTAEAGIEGKHLWNTSVLLGPDGEVAADYRKIHRFGHGGAEPELMEAGSDLVVTDLPAPADALVTGLATCYDLRFPELFRALVGLGAELLLVPAAWPASRVDHWRTLLRARAIENQCVVIGCNTAGTHAGLEMGGHSVVVDPLGVVLAEAGTEQEVLSVEIDPACVGQAREAFPVLDDRRL